jgi:putative DNA primase/helicase
MVPVEEPQFSFEDLSGQIEATSDVQKLLTEILEKVAVSQLSNSIKDLLFRKITKKTKVSLSSLRKDAKRLENSDSDGDNHYSVAIKVIEDFGADNILMAGPFIWVWSDTGVWKALDDRSIKKAIHKVSDSDQLTRGYVDSVLDLIKTEIFIEHHRFDSNISVINCLNGELSFDGEKWVLQGHCKEHFLTTQIPVHFDPQAKAPRFERFLDESFPRGHR